MLESAHQGEDVPLHVTYTDDAGSEVAGDTAPTITITSPNGTEVVSAAATTSLTTGTYEYVWDTASSFDGTGTYTVEITGEFSSETKIVQDTIKITN